MRLFDWLHASCIVKRRASVLSNRLVNTIPQHCSVLDVGSGDGRIASMVQTRRPDIELTGVDIQLRTDAMFPTKLFDGDTLPFADSSFDLVMFIDVLHHTNDPMVLLREAARVTRKYIVIKDHLCDGWFAGTTLRLMDSVGNRRYGVPLPFNYWTRAKWNHAITDLNSFPEIWCERLHLYGWPAGILFDRSLHFVTRLALARS